MEATTTIARAWQARELPDEQLVPSDMLTLRAGDLVPADCCLLPAIISMSLAKGAARIAARQVIVKRGCVLAAAAVKLVLPAVCGVGAGAAHLRRQGSFGQMQPVWKKTDKPADNHRGATKSVARTGSLAGTCVRNNPVSSASAPSVMACRSRAQRLTLPMQPNILPLRVA